MCLCRHLGPQFTPVTTYANATDASLLFEILGASSQAGLLGIKGGMNFLSAKYIKTICDSFLGKPKSLKIFDARAFSTPCACPNDQKLWTSQRVLVKQRERKTKGLDRRKPAVSLCYAIHSENKTLNIPLKTLHLVAVRKAHSPPRNSGGVKQPCKLPGKNLKPAHLGLQREWDAA